MALPERAPERAQSTKGSIRASASTPSLTSMVTSMDRRADGVNGWAAGGGGGGGGGGGAGGAEATWRGNAGGLGGDTSRGSRTPDTSSRASGGGYNPGGGSRMSRSRPGARNWQGKLQKMLKQAKKNVLYPKNVQRILKACGGMPVAKLHALLLSGKLLHAAAAPPAATTAAAATGEQELGVEEKAAAAGSPKQVGDPLSTAAAGLRISSSDSSHGAAAGVDLDAAATATTAAAGTAAAAAATGGFAPTTVSAAAVAVATKPTDNPIKRKGKQQRRGSEGKKHKPPMLLSERLGAGFIGAYLNSEEFDHIFREIMQLSVSKHAKWICKDEHSHNIGRLFYAFDLHNVGFVSGPEFFCTITALSSGTVKAKLACAFDAVADSTSSHALAGAAISAHQTVMLLRGMTNQGSNWTIAEALD